ncbi:stage V sporulation protein AA [Lachnospiraceae bacterium 46-61]
MDIYIKPNEKISITGRKIVYLKDIGEIWIPGQSTASLENLVVYQVPEDTEKTYLISVIDIIKAITLKFPDATVNNVGEMDILLTYQKQYKQQNKLWLYSKITFIALILFTGASTSIMSFHSDAQIPKIFQNYYYMFFGEYNDMPLILAIPYTIGLAMGIILFFNHFSKIYITKDPTPIEIEMTTYEKETNTSIIDALNQKQKSGE